MEALRGGEWVAFFHGTLVPVLPVVRYTLPRQ
jgi:hypothetical protein